MNIKNRNLKERTKLSYINNISSPVVILGMAYITNEQDRIILTDAYNQEVIGKAIANGIMMCF